MKVDHRIIFVCFILGCGATQPKGPSTEPASPQGAEDGTARQTPAALVTVATLIDEKKIRQATKKLNGFDTRAIDTDLAKYVQFLRARLQAHHEPVAGADALEKIADQLIGTAHADEGRFYAGQHAVTVKRCMTATKLLNPLTKNDASPYRFRSMIALSPCLEPIDRLILLGRVPTSTPHANEAAKATRSTLETIELNRVTPRLDELLQAQQTALIIEGLLRRFGSELNRKTLLKFQAVLDEGTALSTSINRLLSQGRVGIILPLTGRSAPVGKQVKSDLVALAAEAAEDEVTDAADRIIVDGGEANRLDEAFEALSQDGRTIGAVGIFDMKLAEQAVRQATAKKLPLILLTLSDAPLCKTCPTWRALHTPLLVARTMVGASLERRAKRYLVMRPDNSYGQRHAHWFRRVVEAAGGMFAGEVVWPINNPPWRQIVEGVQAMDFDAVFLPTDHLSAAQALRHLASVGIWAKGQTPRFGDEEDIKEVTILGTPEWYGVEFRRLAGRYGHHVLVPVPYAQETQRGAQLAQRMRRSAGHTPTQLVALLTDAVQALQTANVAAVESKRSLRETLSQFVLSSGVTAGLDFRQKDALSALIVLQLNPDGFRPFETK
ncbi:MAG: ABC transporter substrate-binding protein [Myxococcota bacterium]|nr:ABC transporter substrate-binding protein [Myxococcota bacterium]